jgi:hypothetical protein
MANQGKSMNTVGAMGGEAAAIAKEVAESKKQKVRSLHDFD